MKTRTIVITTIVLLIIGYLVYSKWNENHLKQLKRESIELVKKSKNSIGISYEEQEAMGNVFRHNSNNYEWNSELTEQDDIYLVSYIDIDKDKGSFWEVNLDNETVKFINRKDSTLEQKYGLTHEPNFMDSIKNRRNKRHRIR